MSVLLIVDDDDAIRDIFMIILTRQGHIVHSAPGGRECLKILETVIPELIILDLMMEPMDGWDTLTAIRTNRDTRELIITIFSGKFPAPEDISRYGGWIDDYLIKPLNLKDLSHIFAQIITRNKNHYDELENLKNQILITLVSMTIYHSEKKSLLPGSFQKSYRFTNKSRSKFFSQTKFEVIISGIFSMKSCISRCGSVFNRE